MSREKMCQYIGCKEKATMFIVRANTSLCNEHYIDTVWKFGCAFTVEPIDQVEPLTVSKGE